MDGQKRFIPFHKISGEKVVVVDGLHPHQVVLSHWKGANHHPEYEADTSGEIVLNALKKDPERFLDLDVSATHFDIDGFVGVFALFYPELSLEYNEVMTEMARIGDFRELEPSSEISLTALKLCCWMNRLEKEHFYRPFGEKDEIEACVPKFEFFLKEFPAVLEDPNSAKSIWNEEYQQVIRDLKKIRSKSTFPEIGLMIKEAEEPIHYYALFSESMGYDLLLSIYEDQRYELEMKYTSWIDLASRANLPRIDLRPLAEELNQIEESNFHWRIDPITDTGPILRLEKDKLHKADRYANPFEREIYNSSIDQDNFVEIIQAFLRNSYQNIEPKRFWSWDEMRRISTWSGK